MPATTRVLFLCCWIVAPVYLSAQETPPADPPPPAENAAPDVTSADILAGHSYHGDVFNEGPRQKAYLMGGTGNVHFPVTTSNPEVQAFIDQGVGQLHGFWYFEAERSFRQAAAIEPQCAIAYWGAAMANLSNKKRASGFIDEAVQRKANADQREAMYIDAAAAYINADGDKRKQRDEDFRQALEAISQKYPNDLEAKAFLALHLYSTRNKDTKYDDVDALMQEIFAVNPMHPAHHFRIHLWDLKDPARALNSAAVCGQTSPSIAHMWHMPGHIYSRLKRYNDAAWQQEASARVDHAHMMRDRVLPDQIHNFAHNNEWLIRNLMNVGRVRDAVDLAKNMIQLPRHPKYNTLSRGSTAYGRARLFQVLSKYELWDEAIALCNSTYLEPTDNEAEQLKRLRLLGAALCNVGQAEQALALLTPLRQRLAAQQADRDMATAQAEAKAKEEKKDDKQVAKAIAEARKPFAGTIGNLEKAILEIEGHAAVASGEFQKGLDLLRKAGGVDASYLARVQWSAGETEAAEKAIRDYVASNKNEVQPLAGLVDILWRNGKYAEAETTFQQLRELSSPLDLDTPVFQRLEPIAAQLWWPADWRVFKGPPDDVGDRPALDSLGPFRWQPSPAPEWTLKDGEGNTRSSKQFQGQPVIAIFYLGYGCLHCAQQLQAFGPMAQKFDEAGIALVAISTDSQADLKRSIENYDGGPLPIPLVANDKLDVFKQYRVFDDFENQPLHGTFVIDEQGFVLWQDISYEPFMEPQFLLTEAQRLLDQRRTGN